MSRERCIIKRTPGVDPSLDVRAFVQQALTSVPPQLAWAEPNPIRVELSGRSGRPVNFRPWVAGTPDWDTDLPLLEARLFWERSALHVVAAEDEGCRWSRIEEIDDGDSGVDALKDEFRVYGRQDLARFGLDGTTPIPDLRAVVYRQQGHIIAWRLVSGQEEKSNG